MFLIWEYESYELNLRYIDELENGDWIRVRSII